MSYDVDAMRAAISDVYSGNSWKWRVRNMADSQVIAVYFSLKEKGKLGLAGTSGAGVSRGKRAELPVLDDASGVHQLTMDEILAQA